VAVSFIGKGNQSTRRNHRPAAQFRGNIEKKENHYGKIIIIRYKFQSEK
jgi:hypothetical protein